MTFTVAIIGRPNVGKSTLFNRLTGTKHALVDDTPGVTRDRREGAANLGPLSFTIFDTAGLEEAEKGSLADRMTGQTLKALERADVVLMMIDGRAGLTPLDEHFAGIVRRSGRPSVLVVNKAEGTVAREAIAEAYRLGLGEPIGISAEHGEGLVDLYDALAPFARDEAESSDDADESDEPEHIDADDERDDILQIAIVGRPNAGKSTLINRLIGEERVLTGPEAGITRDSIAIPFEYQGRKLKLVDTAGIRKKANVTGRLEKMSVADSLRSIRYAPVVVLMMDATAALEKQDLQIADLVEREGRALVLAINKWDLVAQKDREAYLKAVSDRMEEVLTQVKGVPIVTLSAEKGQGLEKLIATVFKVYETWNTRISTGQLNRWLEAALEKHGPPLINGRRFKIRYMTQAKTRPPTFMLSANMSDVPDHYLRYLVHGLRESFGLRGVPIRLKLKTGKNPYQDDEA